MRVNFDTNVPVELSLRQLEGELVESKFGGMQYKFSSNIGPFWVSEAVGGIIVDQCRALGVVPNETIEICKREVSKPGGRKGIQWEVSRVTMVPAKVEEPIAAPVNAPVATPMPVASETRPAWAQLLATQTKQLLDVYAECMTHASAKHGNLVRSEDVRSLMTTVLINMSKNSEGKRNAA